VNRNYLTLDACVLLNLLTTGVIEKILKVAAQEAMICVLVRKESLYLRNENDINEIVSVDLQPLIEKGIISLCDLETDDEQQMFVNLAAKLDDGEAMSLAIALSRNWHLATDDKKARKIFIENAPNEQLLTSTSDLIKRWTETADIDDEEIKSILTKIEIMAHYRPSVSDANFQWWSKVLASSE
jgi:predicted nucleic acid-binding protein